MEYSLADMAHRRPANAILHPSQFGDVTVSEFIKLKKVTGSRATLYKKMRQNPEKTIDECAAMIGRQGVKLSYAVRALSTVSKTDIYDLSQTINNDPNYEKKNTINSLLAQGFSEQAVVEQMNKRRGVFS